MKKINKKVLYIIIALILLAVIIFGILKLTGLNVGGDVTGKCTDSDSGKNIFVKGITKYTNRNYNYTDYCIQPGKIREHWCLFEDMAIRAKTFRCPGECIDGACV